ncbi:MAG TPA: amino acid adenylation domain-containing protein [Paucimonas sp.]|nr:amino acid adenylation domain-containing protein [Paucimonas sp.]
MTAYELLDFLTAHEIGLEIEGDKLRCKAPRGFLTPELLEGLKRHKQEIIAILQGTPPDADAIPRRPASLDHVPLSFSQRQLWFLDQLAPGNPFYNNPVAIGVQGKLDVAMLERSLNDVIRRHEALRTTFSSVEGEPMQHIHADAAARIEVVDLSALPEQERLLRARMLVQADALAPFNLTEGPVIRSGLLKLAEHEHWWLLNVHHIAADGWSIGILIHEITTAYRARCEGKPAPLPELAIQYPDYACWQQRMLQDAALQKQIDYWKRQLAGAPALLALPTDRPRPAVQRYFGRMHAVTLDAAATSGLRELGRRTECTLFTTLLAALSVLLWRYSRQDDICIGTPFANRNRSEVEPLIGHFINTLVIRSRLDGRQRFDDLLRQVRQHVLDAYANQDLPFDHLVNILKPERHTSYSPLFQVMLAVQNLPRGRMELPGLTLTPLSTSTEAAKFDLSVEVTERGDELHIGFEYNTDLFDHSTIERLAGHYRHLLRQIAEDAGRETGQLQLLDREERRRQLHAWNATGRRRAEPATLAARFEEQVLARGDQAAVVADDASITYRELDRRANRLAHGLIAHGVRPDDRVGLCMRRSIDMVVGMLGILKAGAAYMPLDPSHPAERLDAMIEDAAPALIITDGDERDGRWRRLDAVAAGGAGEEAPPVAVQEANLAYVIYTSGSTGRPKGVAVAHGGVANLFDFWVRQFGALPGQAAAQWTNVGFDVSAQEIFLPLTTGGILHLVPDMLRTDPEALMEWMRRQRIAQGYLPPAFVKWICEAPAERLAGLALRQLLVGVEPLPERGLFRMQQALPGLRILNGYGPTETSIYSSAYSRMQDLDRQCPIGRPLDNTRIYLLDEALNPVPVGVAGELYIGGIGLARGYLNRPDLTAERFLPDPYGETAGGRMYRTGDIARYLPDGDIEYLGRQDHQVKLRGFRIELGEIEAALLGLPDVREAVVVIDRDGAGEPRLIAGIERPGEAKPMHASEWRAALEQRLPGYMIPAAFVEVPALPQTPNGKLDRDALIALANRLGGLRQVNLASPRDHIELSLYQIWKRVLLQTDIGIRDSFFDVGGTSISAIKMGHAIREEFGVALPIRDIMLHPTIERLGALLRSGGSGADTGNLIEFRKGDGRRKVVCIHPAGGTAFCYLSLAKVLPEDCGVYGIQSPGVNPGETFLPSIEAMAQAYLALIEPVADQDLIILGLSFGGLIAFEMGRRLTAAGHDRVTVVLLDTQGLEDPAHRAMVKPVELAEFRDKLVKFNGMYPGIEDQQIEQYFNIYNHNRACVRDYEVPASAARLVLVQAIGGRDRPFLREGSAFWRRRALGTWRMELVRGDHWELLETAEVMRVSRLLRRELARFDSAVPENIPA